MRRLPWFLLAVATLSEPGLKASYCFWHSWTLSEIEHAPVLLAGHVVSLERKNGPHFTGDPRHSAPGQQMIADVEVLRFIEQGGAGQMPAGGRLKIRFIGRDGPDFGFCPEPLPDLEPGQTLLVALRGNPHAPNEPWSLLGANGMGLATRVATKMEEPARGDNDAHSFIVREFVNSFRSDDPIARFTAASLFAQQGDSLEPELSDWLKRSVGNSTADWARILGSILISYPGRPLTMDEVEIGRLPQPPPRFNPLPLAQLARSQLPDRPAAERLIWQSLLADLPRLADEPYHPLFSYQPSYPLLSAVRYLTPYAGDASFSRMVKTALRKDRAGSSTLAAKLIENGQRSYVPPALDRAMKVIRRPEADGSDVFQSIQLVLRDGNERQRQQYANLTTSLRAVNPDFAAFLELKLTQAQQSAARQVRQ